MQRAVGLVGSSCLTQERFIKLLQGWFSWGIMPATPCCIMTISGDTAHDEAHVFPVMTQSAKNESGGTLAPQVMQTHGRERTRQDYQRLFADAGFQLRRIVRTRGPLSVTEAVPI